LFGVSTYSLVNRERKDDSKGAIRVRALAEELVRVIWPELMGQGLDPLVHFPKERLVLG
jgi:hypothetical protein